MSYYSSAGSGTYHARKLEEYSHWIVRVNKIKHFYFFIFFKLKRRKMVKYQDLANCFQSFNFAYETVVRVHFIPFLNCDLLINPTKL